MRMRTLTDLTRGMGRLMAPPFVQVVRQSGAHVLGFLPGLLRPSVFGLFPSPSRFSMNQLARDVRPSRVAASGSTVEVYSRFELARCRPWKGAFAAHRKDYRYYELVEDTIRQGFDYRYFVIKDEFGEVRAVQPFFILDQDLLAGVSPKIRESLDFIRRFWPRFMMMRALMVGCAAGEGHLDGRDEQTRDDHAQVLASAIRRQARALNVKLIVLKEFPACYRRSLECFREAGFVRIPSLPMVRLNIDYASFEEYMNKALSANMRRNLRKKFKAAARGPAIVMSLVEDVSPIVDEVYGLYLQVFERSKFQFEKLSREYFLGLGRRMPDKVRFFVWRQEGRIVAFAMCLVHEETLYFEYLGLDYRIALDVHLYHNAIRDLLAWGMANGYKRCASTAVKYDPKYHLRFLLDPLDLYVRHSSNLFNVVLKLLLPLVEPTRYDKTLKQFANYADLWGSPEDERGEGVAGLGPRVRSDASGSAFESLASDHR